MTQKYQQTIGIILVILLAVLGGYYVYRDSHKATKPLQEASTSTPSIATTTVPASTVPTSTGASGPKTAPGSSASHMASTQSTGSKATIITSKPATIPSLVAPVVVTNNLDADVRAAALIRIEGLRAGLQQNANIYVSWINLGKEFKLVGDYRQAAAAWKYATVLAPKEPTPFYRLGDLYHYYLKDYVAAETNYRIAIVNNPNYIPPYLALDALRSIVFKDPQSGLVVLEQGLKANPSDASLLISLAERYITLNDKTKAKTYYEQALLLAREMNDSALEASISVALGNL